MKLLKKEIIYVYILLILIFNIIHSLTIPLIDDEAYYWVWSKKIDFGYFDHPSMIAVFIKVGYSIIANTLGVRLVSIIANVVFWLIWIKILEPKTSNDKLLFVGLFGSTAIFHGFGFIATPDSPLLLFCSLFLWRWKMFLQKQNYVNSLLLAVSIVLTLYSKYQGALLVLLAMLPFCFKLIKNKYLYLTIFIAIILYSPHLYWQMENKWPSVTYHFFERNKKILKNIPTPEWLLGFLTIANPLLLYFYVKSIYSRKVHDIDWKTSLRWIVVGGTFFFFILSFSRRIQPQWNLIIYLALIPLTYLYYKEVRNKLIIKLSFIYLTIIFIVRIIIIFPWVIEKSPMYKLKEFVLKAESKTKGIAVFERYQKTAAYNFYTQKPAAYLKVYTQRKTQYNLWDYENELQNKTITFFGLEPISDYSILDEEGKKIYYKTIENFSFYPEVKCEVSPVQNGKVKMIWQNPYNRALTFAKGTNMEWGFLTVDAKKLYPVGIDVIEEPIIKLPSDGILETEWDFKELDPNFRYFVFVKFYGLSGIIISNEIKYFKE